MASEITWRHTVTGATLYFTIRAAPKSMWNTDIAALQNLVSVEWTHYDLAMTEVADCYLYIGDWPLPSPAVGFYWVDVFLQAGALPIITDTLLTTMFGYWNGTTFEMGTSDLVNAPNATAITAIQNGLFKLVNAAKLLLMENAVTSGSVSDAAATQTSFITDLTEATNNHYRYRILEFTSGNLMGQGRQIIDYSGATKAVTLDSALTEAPANGDDFVILGYIAP